MTDDNLMHAVTIAAPGGPEALTLTTVPRPRPGEREVLIKVAAAGVNGADLMQRRGHYPPPPGAPEWLGLEVSGRVVAVGANTSRADIGDEVCALLSGGGYAEYVSVHESLVLPVPHGVSLRDAAALPEALVTAWSNIRLFAGLKAGQSLLVHGGSSGVGLAAIQIARAHGARVVATVGSEEKAAFCRRFGADAVNYRQADFVSEVGRLTAGAGVDVVLDMVGGDYIARDLAVLATGGHIMLIADRTGTPASFPAGLLIAKRARLQGTAVRPRPLDERAALLAGLQAEVWPMVDDGRVRVVVDSVYPLAAAADAHRRMESSAHMGKILLAVD
ncbi:MAG TPA: NAD(P)H-quinone oxidoreductase [Microbacteriaceae bacterium]|nr:NAD(P)H-quinone oxidoreductase [Microbacteriaceae bacterium]